MPCASPPAMSSALTSVQTSVRHTEALKRKYNLTNLEVYQLPVERVGELGRRFDKIVCTGVLHHLPDPDAGLRALREVLRAGRRHAPDGLRPLRPGRRLHAAGLLPPAGDRSYGAGDSGPGGHTHGPAAHPSAGAPVGRVARFPRQDALADALLNPQDRAYTVPQVFDFIERCGLVFGRWVRQAPYLAQCGALAATPHAARSGRAAASRSSTPQSSCSAGPCCATI